MKNELREFFRETNLPKGKKGNIFFVVALIIAIVFLGFSGCDSEKKMEASSVENSDFSKEKYREELETKLENTLKKINGAGEVSVFIYIDSGGEKVLATDERGKTDTDAESSLKETEENVVLSGKGSEQVPYVVKERLPSPVGVLVVAKGAKDEKVRYEIYDAVKALFGLAAHRIWITY